MSITCIIFNCIHAQANSMPETNMQQIVALYIPMNCPTTLNHTAYTLGPGVESV